MGWEQSRQSCLAANAIAADAFSATNAAVNAFAVTTAASAAASAAASVAAASAAATVTVIPFLHCAKEYLPWDFDRPHGP